MCQLKFQPSGNFVMWFFSIIKILILMGIGGGLSLMFVRGAKPVEGTSAPATSAPSVQEPQVNDG